MGGGTDWAAQCAQLCSERTGAQLCLLQPVLCPNAAPPWLQSRTEEEQAGLRSELDIATAEVDRAQQRLLALEGEREKVMQQVGRRPSPQVQALACQTDPACKRSHRKVLLHWWCWMLAAAGPSIGKQLERSAVLCQLQASVVPADDSAQEQQTRVVEQSLRSELQSQVSRVLH